MPRIRKRKPEYSESALVDAFRKKHGYAYQYLPFPEAFTTKTRVTIVCPIHGEFQQLIERHLRGQGCAKCFAVRNGVNRRLGRSAWIRRFESVHGRGKYDYAKVTEDIQQYEKIEIFCPDHNVTFYQSPHQHWRCRQGCPKCGRLKMSETIKKKLITRRKYERRARAVHGPLFEYSQLPDEFSLYDTIIIFCNEHNHIFFCVAKEHLEGKRCPMA